MPQNVASIKMPGSSASLNGLKFSKLFRAINQLEKGSRMQFKRSLLVFFHFYRACTTIHTLTLYTVLKLTCLSIQKIILPSVRSAEFNRPCDSGDNMCSVAHVAPDALPNKVTLPGSPPKLAMLSRIHFNAKT
jgi:hypothetical protein